MSTTLTAKGQVTIPKKIRDVLGLAPGNAVEFDVDEQGRIVIRKAGEKPIRRTHHRDRFARDPAGRPHLPRDGLVCHAHLA
ncbi:MAG: AbrB/MazE/SpoVT family DNA-binding domain-containing protein [Gammaproteobacteria bacterium]